jgi:hypothetical protein
MSDTATTHGARTNDRIALRLGETGLKNFNQIQEYLRGEGHAAELSDVVRFALFRAAAGLPPPRRVEQERQSAAE